MKSFRLIGLICFYLLCATQAWAYVELNGFYSSDALAQTSGNRTDSKMYFEGAIGFSIDKASRWLAGWGYASFSNAESAGAGSDVKYSSTQMGPRFVYNIDKAKNWSMALAYYLVTKAEYSASGGTSEQWKGTALKFDAGYNLPITESFFVGLRMNYSAASYTDKYVGSTWTTESNTKTSIYPSAYSIFYF
jgi:hypothetical protein